MSTFTRASGENMNEVLADFIGYKVRVTLRKGWVLQGPLTPDPDPNTDGYMIGPYCFEKDEVMQLIGLEPEKP